MSCKGDCILAANKLTLHPHYKSWGKDFQGFMQIKKVISYLETIAPPAYQESYDNAGLIVGDPTWEVTGVMVCLDSTEAVIDEAINNNCNLVIAHHPIVFKGLKRFNGHHYVERVVMMAIKYDIAIYAIHTNLDNVYSNGVNGRIAEQLGLLNTQILRPRQGMKKLTLYVPANESDKLRNRLFKAGAGQIGPVRHLSHASVGAGTRNSSGNAEVRLEMIFPTVVQRQLEQEIRAEGDRVHYDIVALDNQNPLVGAGIIGTLKEPMAERAFLEQMKRKMKTACVRYTALRRRKVRKVAICGGAGGFLLRDAIAQSADVFITADYKYHEFFDANGQIVIADIGHYESEQYTIELLYSLLSENFSKFAVFATTVNTNPVNYL